MNISATAKTPQVLFDEANASLSLSGVSCPENPLAFYSPIFEFAKTYVQTNSKITIKVKLDYFNTGSSKCLLTLFEIFSSSAIINENITIHWITDKDDSELKEAGMIFQEMTQLPFIFDEIED